MTSRPSQESARPLLHDDGESVHTADDDADPEAQRPAVLWWRRVNSRGHGRDGSLTRWQAGRRRAQDVLLSRRKHYVVLSVVALDVAALLTNVFVELVACQMGLEDEPWVAPTIEALKVAGLVFSCAFLVELILCLVAFSLSYFDSWFHRFDAAVIVTSFVVDVAAHGVAEDIASLVVVLRLWRLVKVIEEVSVGASERMEEMEAEMEKLREENRVMGLRLARDRDSDRDS